MKEKSIAIIIYFLFLNKIAFAKEGMGAEVGREVYGEWI
jgi:hypothetical protein